MSYQVLIVVLVVFVLLVSYLLGFTPSLVAVVFLFFSLVAYCYYAKDKKAAVNGDWRVPENTLHILALLCGWPGALIAQGKFRHKTKKVSFRAVFWLTVIANSCGFIWLHSPQGNVQLHKSMNEIQSSINAHVDEKNIRHLVSVLTGFRG